MTKPNLTSLALGLSLAALACKSRDDLSALREEASPPPFGFADVRRIVEEKSIRSVDELLPLLPEDFRSRYVLLSDSKSTQEASPSAPRVLLYTEGARFVLAFNGDPDVSGFNTIETAELHPDKPSYVFREIEFGETAAHVSEDNPKACAACHRQPLRPSWEGWPKWPEAYFGKDTSSDGSEHAEDERKSFKNFIENRGTSGRYRHLVRLDQYTADAERLGRGEPANSFNQIVMSRIEDMVLAEVQAHPRFHRLRPVFEAAIIGCDKLGDFVPDAEKATFAVTFEKIQSDTLAKNARAGRRTIALRWLFEAEKLATAHWSPSLRVKYSFRRAKETGDDLDLVRAFKERVGFGEIARGYVEGAAPLAETCAKIKLAAAG